MCFEVVGMALMHGFSCSCFDFIITWCKGQNNLKQPPCKISFRIWEGQHFSLVMYFSSFTYRIIFHQKQIACLSHMRHKSMLLGICKPGWDCCNEPHWFGAATSRGALEWDDSLGVRKSKMLFFVIEIYT